MADEFQVSGGNSAAQFTLQLHRGDGMTLLAMDWKVGKELVLTKPPRSKMEKAWWVEDYTNARKIKDRELFA